jgi:hypothetical protein
MPRTVRPNIGVVKGCGAWSCARRPSRAGVIRPGFCRGDRTTSERDGIGIFFKSSFDKTPDQLACILMTSRSGIKDAYAITFWDASFSIIGGGGGGAVGDAFLIIFRR